MIDQCIHKQPNANDCFVCGRANPHGLYLSFYDDGIDTVKTRTTIKSQFQGYPGIVHGGVLASIMDEVVGRVAMVGDHHRFMMTVNMKVQFRNPAPIGVELTGEGKAVRMRGRIAKAEGKIFLPDGTIACQAELTLADMPQQVKGEDRLDFLGWAIDAD